jgi:hypothetical protein
MGPSPVPGEEASTFAKVLRSSCIAAIDLS